MEARTLLTFHDLKVEVETAPGQELMEHMHSTVLGTPGGFRYTHLDLEDRLNEPGENYFMYLRKGGKMMGSVGFVGRHTVSGGLAHDAWMIRYFSIKAPMRSTPRKRKEKHDLKDEHKRSSVLGRFIQPVFARPEQLRGGQHTGRDAADVDHDDPRPSIIYALIESKNLRSMNFSSQMGLETVRHVASFPFSRLTPRRSERVGKLEMKEQDEMRSLLKGYYTDFSLYFEGPLFRDDNYFVIREGGNILAGIQTWEVRWKVLDMGSPVANRLVRFLTRIPWLRSRLDLDELRLLAFDQLYCAPGNEEALYELLEGVLAMKKVYLGMFMMDRNAHIYNIFKTRKKLGLLHRFLGEFKAEFRIRFNNIPEENKQQFLDKPVFVPSYDNS